MNKIYDEKMVDYAMKMVYAMAHKLQKKHCLSQEMFEDYVSAGMVGATKALNTFDASKGFAFSTYVSRCILNEIFMSTRKQQIQTDSLDKMVGDDQDIQMLEKIDSSINIEDDILWKELLNLIDNNKEEIFTKKELIVFNILRKQPDITRTKIAEIMGYTKTNACRYVNRIRIKLKAFAKQQGYNDLF